jgi:hypothetical protein
MLWASDHTLNRMFSDHVNHLLVAVAIRACSYERSGNLPLHDGKMMPEDLGLHRELDS